MGGEITTPPKRLGTWLSLTTDTIYQASSDGFALAMRSLDLADVSINTDDSTPPTVCRSSETGAAGIVYRSVSTPVRKNDYWKAFNANWRVFWIPLEP